MAPGLDPALIAEMIAYLQHSWVNLVIAFEVESVVNLKLSAHVVRKVEKRGANV